MCMRVEFHQRKNGLPSLCALSMKSERACRVSRSSHRLHALAVSGPVSSILPPAKLWMTPRGPNRFLNSGILRVVGMLGLLFGVQVIEVAEELVEAVDGRQMLVAVAEMVLAELAGLVAVRLQQLGDGRVLLHQPFVRAGQADLGQAGADRRLAGDEGGAPGGAALLAVPVGEQGALFGDPIDVRRPVPHHAQVVGADVVPADVIAPDDEDVRLRRGLRPCRRRVRHGQAQQEQSNQQRRQRDRAFHAAQNGGNRPSSLESGWKLRGNTIAHHQTPGRESHLLV